MGFFRDDELGSRFPEAKPVHHSLGYNTLTDLVLSFEDFTITGEHPKWVVQYRKDHKGTGGVNLRSEVGILIGKLIDKSIRDQRSLFLPTIGLALGGQHFGKQSRCIGALGFKP